jgi:hypothetical protein
VELLGSEYQPGKKDEKGKKAAATETKAPAKKAPAAKPKGEKAESKGAKAGRGKTSRKPEKETE